MPRTKSKENPVGRKFNMLTVIRSVGQNKFRQQVVECQCECGNSITRILSPLKRGCPKSCGCHLREDFTGRKFNMLTVIREVKRTKGLERLVECQCECGNSITTLLNNLKKGYPKSCGCRMRNYVGERYGKLTVLESVGRTQRGWQIVKCLCDCGKIIRTQARMLVTGNKKSCGCLVSYKEEIIADWLIDQGFDEIENDVDFSPKRFEYKRQYRIAECNRILPLPFDFAISMKGELQLVEYHGKQHYEQEVMAGRSHHDFLKIEDADAIKGAFCDNFNYPLLVLNHTHLDILYTLDWFLTPH